MHLAIEGCSHGELDVIYAAVVKAQEMSGFKIDVLICCGDFQSVRNPKDLRCMAVPTKYMKMHSFYKYYSGEKKAPVLTIFIGGNHEASNYLQELPYGGWVAPNIYYLGYGGVVNVGGLRIGGISGIYKGPDYLKGRYERPPYTDSSIRSVYHVRNLEVFRMKQLDQCAPFDIFLSHDWPRDVTKYGDAEGLCRQKQFFRDEIESGTLGSRAAQELLHFMKPRYWFAGHLHVKFPAIVIHNEESEKCSSTTEKKQENSKDESTVSEENKQRPKNEQFTRFLALDKCLPRREFLQILEVKSGRRHKYQNVSSSSVSSNNTVTGTPLSYEMHDEDDNIILYHDLEWLTVLRLTNHLLKVTANAVYMPGPGGSEPYQFTPTEAQLMETLHMMNNNLVIGKDKFSEIAPAYDPVNDAFALDNIDTLHQPDPLFNPYTVELCEALNIDDPIAVLLGLSNNNGDKSKSLFLITPKRKPSQAEMNVTLDPSKVNSQDEAPVSDDDSADIMFEVTINSSLDGSSHGTLSPIATPLRSGRARKSLKLSTPRNSGLETQESSPIPSAIVQDFDSPLSSSSSEHKTDASDQSSGKSVPSSSSDRDRSLENVARTNDCIDEDPAPNDESSFMTDDCAQEDPAPNNEACSSTSLSQSSNSDEQCSLQQFPSSSESSSSAASVSANNSSNNSSDNKLGSATENGSSPKRLFCSDKEKPQETPVNVKENPTAGLIPKPSKIKRRNAAVYANVDD
uniref:Lariat debranching enzyme-like n=1 Tax=Hirondellea gigas TaxID=1518452 RepID=A0A2P2I5P5_9CRUS